MVRAYSTAVLFVLVFSLAGNLMPLLNIVAVLALLPLYWAGRANPADDAVRPEGALRWWRWATAFWLLSYLATQAGLANLFSFDFLRRDGALFFAYLPLVLIAGFTVPPRLAARLVAVYLSVLSAVALLGALQFAAATAGMAPLGFSPWLQVVHYSDLSGFGFHGFFRSHNAAGAAYALGASLALVLWLFHDREKAHAWGPLWLALTFAGLALSKSRTAYLAFALVLVFLLLRLGSSQRRRLGRLALWAAPVVLFWVLQPEVSARATSFSAMDDPNIVDRVLYFRKAWDDFLLSPLVGIGFGRFNDVVDAYWGVRHVAFIGVAGDLVDEPYHAHNSFLHFLAEGGAIGLLLMMSLWAAVYSWARRRQRTLPRGSLGCALAAAVQVWVVLALLLSLSEHTIGTAVTPLTVLTLAGVLRNLAAWHGEEAGTTDPGRTLAPATA